MDTTCNAVIALTGQSGSGKSSLARELARRLPAHAVSFGAFVRAQAKQRGGGLDVPSLQALGQALIDELGTEEFVRQVMTQAASDEPVADDDDCVIVLDGVRSREVWQAVQQLAKRSVLVYLDVDQQTRSERIADRGSVDLTELQQAAAHPMEAKVPELQTDADLILRPSDLDDWVARVMKLLTERGIGGAQQG